MVSHWLFVHPSIFLFPDNNLSRRILIKLGVCIDVVEIWFGIVNGQLLSIFCSYLPGTDDIFSKCQ